MPYTEQDLEFVRWIEELRARFQEEGQPQGEFCFTFSPRRCSDRKMQWDRCTVYSKDIEIVEENGKVVKVVLKGMDGVQFFAIREHTLELRRLHSMDFFCGNLHYPFIRLYGTNSLFTPGRFTVPEQGEQLSEESEDFSQGCEGDD